MTHTIYIVLTKTGTLLSKAIGMYTGKEMNHASVSFDAELFNMYSFGRTQLNNPLSGGFLRENAETGLLEPADCVIYRCTVSHYQYLEMRRIVHHMYNNRDHYKYNFLGLFGIVMQMELRRERAYFCSQFVATLLKMGGLPVYQNPAFMTPHCISELPYLEKVFAGKLSDYLQGVREPAMLYG
ncbi:hypothetical protein AEA09_08245 [Lysinibacillus contaminans]|uniref:Uncharacterized protein n=1 Tax=Lysinibacillus contaminans TaxID=1293441 RepID=A0ABR5K0Z1_9BACI|nr:hypothetical protein [Lysinibacillus contaminans]KOS68541.1 hypothetical protein AEA09_08245 [Lysinibacillus contaminans]